MVTNAKSSVNIWLIVQPTIIVLIQDTCSSSLHPKPSSSLLTGHMSNTTGKKQAKIEAFLCPHPALLAAFQNATSIICLGYFWHTYCIVDMLHLV